MGIGFVILAFIGAHTVLRKVFGALFGRRGPAVKTAPKPVPVEDRPLAPTERQFDFTDELLREQ